MTINLIYPASTARAPISQRQPTPFLRALAFDYTTTAAPPSQICEAEPADTKIHWQTLSRLLESANMTNWLFLLSPLPIQLCVVFVMDSKLFYGYSRQVLI